MVEEEEINCRIKTPNDALTRLKKTIEKAKTKEIRIQTINKSGNLHLIKKEATE